MTSTALLDAPRRTFGAALAAALLVAIGPGGAALGQQSTNARSSANSSVTVDLGVLDELGPSTAAPRPQDSGRSRKPAAPSDRIRLTPPPIKPKFSPDERSAEVPAKPPGPNVRRAPPPVPRSKPRRPITTAAPAPSPAARPVTPPKPAAPKPAAKTGKAEPVDLTVQKPAAEKKSRETGHTAAITAIAPKRAARPEPPPEKAEKQTEPARTAKQPEAKPDPRLASAIDAPMSLLRPHDPKPVAKNQPAAVVPARIEPDRTKPKKAGRETVKPTPADPPSGDAAVSAPAPTTPPKAIPAPPEIENSPRADVPEPAPTITAMAAPAPTPMPKKATVTAEPEKTAVAKKHDAPTAAPKTVRRAPRANAPAARQQASLQPVATPPIGAGSTVRLAFASDRSTLSRTARKQVERVAERLKDNNRLRLQLMAYADGKSRSTSEARRLSLYRALAVRSQLIKTGVRSTRIDVRALGNKFGDGPADRVDLVVSAR